MFCNFLRKIRKFKMAAIFGETKFFSKLAWLLCRDTLWVKISSKSLYLARFSRYKHFCVLQFLRKIRKFNSAEIPFGSKISSKSLYLARFSRYKHFCVLQFLRKIRKFKMAAIFGETKFFSKLAWLLCRDTLWVKNFVEIALCSTVFEI